MQPIIYLDMDGVLCNFEKAMYAMGIGAFGDNEFRKAVKENKIFENLEMMPNAKKLLDTVKAYKDVNRQILTSVGIENDPEHKRLTSAQKSKWLLANGIGYLPNFVERMTKKGEYANEYAILIDDTERAINAFRENGGIGILHKDAEIENTIAQLNEAVYTIRNKIAKMYVG